LVIFNGLHGLISHNLSVIPKLLYGNETWTVNAKDVSGMAAETGHKI
jgi:hypothetical protein